MQFQRRELTLRKQWDIKIFIKFVSDRYFEGLDTSQPLYHINVIRRSFINLLNTNQNIHQIRDKLNNPNAPFFKRNIVRCYSFRKLIQLTKHQRQIPIKRLNSISIPFVNPRIQLPFVRNRIVVRFNKKSSFLFYLSQLFLRQRSHLLIIIQGFWLMICDERPPYLIKSTRREDKLKLFIKSQLHGSCFHKKNLCSR